MTTIVEEFPKSEITRTKVEAEREERLERGAVSSEITEDDTNWILTTEMN